MERFAPLLCFGPILGFGLQILFFCVIKGMYKHHAFQAFFMAVLHAFLVVSFNFDILHRVFFSFFTFLKSYREAHEKDSRKKCHLSKTPKSKTVQTFQYFSVDSKITSGCSVFEKELKKRKALKNSIKDTGKCSM